MGRTTGKPDRSAVSATSRETGIDGSGPPGIRVPWPPAPAWGPRLSPRPPRSGPVQPRPDTGAVVEQDELLGERLRILRPASTARSWNSSCTQVPVRAGLLLDGPAGPRL